MISKPAIFLDRDGTIIEDTHYINDPDKVVLLPHVVEGLKLMRQKGYLLFSISNQSGVGRKLITLDQFEAVHDRYHGFLEKKGVPLDGYLYCFHHPDENCQCRKPGTQLIPKTFGDCALDLNRSAVIGDSECDLLLADALSATGYLVLTGKGESTQSMLQETARKDKYPALADLLEIAQALPEVN